MENVDNNFCANPDNDPKGDWCFTDTRGDSEYGYCTETCDCETPTTIISTLTPLTTTYAQVILGISITIFAEPFVLIFGCGYLV